MPTQSISTSSLIFSSQATDFSRTLSSLKRSTLSITNRLRSINEDAEFVSEVAKAYNLPLVANERCGSWYIPLEKKVESAYFKSTDGHTGQWAFSLRRLNVQVLDLVQNYGGCVIVDSTRRGKSIPDALMKTVPIWCAVFNRLLFSGDEEAGRLYTPPKYVSRSEHVQIEQRLDDFVNELKKLQLDVAELRTKISKPLRPLWVTRESELPALPPEYTDFHPIVLCTASRRVVGGELSEGGYIQGAGDDAEGWSHGLTPTTFWKHKDQLFAAGEEDLPDMIASYVRSSQNASRNSILFTIRNAPWLSIGSYDCLDTSTHDKYSAIITIGQRAALPEVQPPLKKHLHLECRDRKLGSRDLRTQLPQLRPFIEGLQSLERLLVCDFTGKDLAVGVTLALLCLNTSANGHFQSSNTLEQSIDKDFIKQRLSWIMTSHPAMSPSRTTLQSINDYLLTEYTRSLPTGIASLRVSPRNTSTSPAEVIFLALEGHWTLDRSIVNFRNDGLAGTVTGTATFFARTPTSEYTQSEYLYREEGTFDAGVGIQMNVNRRWIWRLAKPTTVGVSEDPDISIHFVKADGETEDYLYNRLPLPREEATDDNADDSASGTMVLSVDAEHPCGQDFYVSSYKFWLRGGVRLEKWEVEHKVKGPAKDYISRTTHTRTDLFTTRMREQHCGLESSTL